MRIGNYVSIVSGQLGFERNVSGHIQIPLHSMKLLQEAGHEVELITNRFDEKKRSLPFCIPPGTPVHLVSDGRRRGGFIERTGDQKHGFYPLRMIQQVLEIQRLAKERKFDVMHFWGMARSVEFAGALRLVGLDLPTVGTIGGASFKRPGFIRRRFWNRVDAVLTSTSYVHDRCAELGIATRILRHGVIRDLRAELGNEPVEPRHRVLFWRDPTLLNGADICLKVYDQLAGQYPNISFDIAIRPCWEVVPGIDELAAKHPNVHVHYFPYPPGISLAKLVAESICVLLPFRKLTIHPQLAIMESLAAGTPVITTAVQSSPEQVIPHRNGLLVSSEDPAAAAAAVKYMLDNPQAACQMGQQALDELASTWRWDQYTRDLIQVYEEVRACWRK